MTLKRLNQSGFGIGAMIGFICFFVVALVVVAILIYQNGLGDDPLTSMILLKEEISFAYWG